MSGSRLDAEPHGRGVAADERFPAPWSAYGQGPQHRPQGGVVRVRDPETARPAGGDWAPTATPADQPDRSDHPGPPRVVVAGLGDTGVLVATRLARSCQVVGISTRPALVSGQELGNRLTDPARWRRSYLVPYRRFRRLDRAWTVHGRITSVDLDRREVRVDRPYLGIAVEPYDVLVIATGASNGFWRHDRVEDLPAIDDQLATVAARLEAAATIAVVGGGATGVSVADNLARRGGTEVHLFHSGDVPLPGYHPKGCGAGSCADSETTASRCTAATGPSCPRGSPATGGPRDPCTGPPASPSNT